MCRPCSPRLECLICLTLKANLRVVPHLWVKKLRLAGHRASAPRNWFCAPSLASQMTAFPSPRGQMGARDYWWNSDFQRSPQALQRACHLQPRGNFLWSWLIMRSPWPSLEAAFTFNEGIWVSARIDVHLAHCPPDNFGIH